MQKKTVNWAKNYRAFTYTGFGANLSIVVNMLSESICATFFGDRRFEAGGYGQVAADAKKKFTI